jgi:N-hydroxyarylamine O-acetyltransferase
VLPEPYLVPHPAPFSAPSPWGEEAQALDDAHLDAYLAHLGVRPERPSRAFLTRLHRRFLQRVPFENLDIRWQIPIPLDVGPAWSKVVESRRGGFCYELNALFAWALERLGFDVALLSGRVWRKQTRSWGPEYDHLALRVRVDGEELLADVGFGDSFRTPLDLPSDTTSDVSGGYRLLLDGGEVQLEHASTPEHWRPVYRFALRPRALSEFAGMCTWQQTSPESHFTGHTVFTLARPWGRTTITERYRMETRDGVSTRRRFEHPQAWLQELRTRFGVRGPLGPLVARLAG